jgi:hypothetical protein
MNKIESSIGQTSKVDLAHSPRFMQWLGGAGHDVLLSALPRETKIAFLLYGRPKDAAKATADKLPLNTLLGWVVQPLLNERGVLLSGAKTLRLWGVAAGEKDHGHGHKRIPYDEPDFIFRATTREENCKR